MESVVQKFISFVFLLFLEIVFIAKKIIQRIAVRIETGPLQCFPDVDYYMHTS